MSFRGRGGGGGGFRGRGGGGGFRGGRGGERRSFGFVIFEISFNVTVVIFIITLRLH